MRDIKEVMKKIIVGVAVFTLVATPFAGVAVKADNITNKTQVENNADEITVVTTEEIDTKEPSTDNCTDFTDEITTDENASTEIASEETVVEPVIKLKWQKKKTKIKAGKKYTFKVKASVDGVKKTKVKWSLSNKKYATISKKGVLTAKKKGKVTVKCTFKGKTIKCRVQILPKKVIGIDPGHQQTANMGTEPVGPGSSVYKTKVAGGTCGVSTKLPEYKLTLAVALKLRKELINRGYDVVLTRKTNDVNISNVERAKLINDSDADIFIRIHADGINSPSVTGASGLIPSARNPYNGNLADDSKKLCECIMNNYTKATGIKHRGNVNRDDLSGSNWSKVPVMLIELGFMTNPAEDRFMASDEGQTKMVTGMADGIDEYYGFAK